jgi:hypothetical protein
MEVPLEKEEQATFVQWLELKKLLFSATAQSTYTKSWSQKRHNHATGLRKGVPDMIVVISPERAKNGTGTVLFIEMKRQQGSVVSAEQKIWIDSITSIDSNNVCAYVCKGAQSAIDTVCFYLKA